MGKFLSFVFTDSRHTFAALVPSAVAIIIGLGAWITPMDHLWHNYAISGFMAFVVIMVWLRLWLIFKRVQKK